MTTPRKNPAAGRPWPMKGGARLVMGEMTPVVIGTVVRLGYEEGGCTPDKLFEALSGEGYNLTRHRAACWLVTLAAAGRIERIAKGRYKGV